MPRSVNVGMRWHTIIIKATHIIYMGFRPFWKIKRVHDVIDHRLGLPYSSEPPNCTTNSAGTPVSIVLCDVLPQLKVKLQQISSLIVWNRSKISVFWVNRLSSCLYYGFPHCFISLIQFLRKSIVGYDYKKGPWNWIFLTANIYLWISFSKELD